MGPLREFAHELRNPLVAITSAAQALGMGGMDSEQRERLSRAVVSEAERMGRMVLHYLDGGATPLIGETLITEAPHRLLRELFDLNLPAAARERVHSHIRGPLPELRVDPDHLRQMLLNLLDNALTATHSKGEVIIEAFVEESGVALAVWDTGVGISPEHLPHIFQDGFTTRGDQRRGLGLGITQRLCKNAGGQIQVRSLLGHGTVFTVWLPRA